MQTILVIDDDENLRDTIGLMLEKEDFRPILAADGKTGLQEAITMKPSLILVDLRMPGLSGVEVCKQLRASGVRTPLIVLSAIGDEVDKVLMLEIGADDYVVKPFGTRELLARIRAVLRRSAADDSKVIAFADTEVDLDRRVVRRRGEEIKLTRAEFNLLTFFLQNPERALTRDMILNSVWGYESFPNTRTVDAHVVRLRQKLEPDVNAPRHFISLSRGWLPFPAMSSASRIILVVEDADLCTTTLEIALHALPDLVIKSAPTAEEALNFLLMEKVSAMITDLHLPRMDGFELIARVRSEPRHSRLPILVISGDSDSKTPERALRLGANAFFAKPYSPAAVRLKLEQLMNAT